MLQHLPFSKSTSREKVFCQQKKISRDTELRFQKENGKIVDTLHDRYENVLTVDQQYHALKSIEQKCCSSIITENNVCTLKCGTR